VELRYRGTVYIIFPLLIWFAYKVRFNIWLVLASIFVISFGFNIVQVHFNPVAAFYSPVPRFWELIVGSFLAYFDLYKKDVYVKANGRSWLTSNPCLGSCSLF